MGVTRNYAMQLSARRLCAAADRGRYATGGAVVSQLKRITRLAPLGALAWTLLAFSSAHAQAPTQASIVVAGFEVQGNGRLVVAETIRGALAAALDRDPCVEAQAERADTAPSPDYVLRGTVYEDEEGGRAFVALQLVNARTSERLWFDNYDYRGINGEMMAEDILRYLKATAPVTERSRITRSCSGR